MEVILTRYEVDLFHLFRGLTNLTTYFYRGEIINLLSSMDIPVPTNMSTERHKQKTSGGSIRRRTSHGNLSRNSSLDNGGAQRGGFEAFEHKKDVDISDILANLGTRWAPSRSL